MSQNDTASEPAATPLLDRATIDVPCSADWNAMTGDERTRHCGACKLNVYNVAEMTRPEAEELIRTSEGRVCMRIYRRPDGTVLTKDCVSLLAATRRRMRIAATALVAALGLGTATAAAAGVAHDNGGIRSAATWKQMPFRAFASLLPAGWLSADAPAPVDSPATHGTDPGSSDAGGDELMPLMGEVDIGDVLVAPHPDQPEGLSPAVAPTPLEPRALLGRVMVRPVEQKEDQPTQGQ